MKPLFAVMTLLLCHFLGSNILVLTISDIEHIDYSHGGGHTHGDKPYQGSDTTHHEGYANDHRHSIDIVLGSIGNTVFTTSGSNLNIALTPTGIAHNAAHCQDASRVIILRSTARAPPRLSYALIIKKTSVFIV